jgi:hypothetical protein
MAGSAEAVLVGENNGQPVFDIQIIQPGNDPIPDQQAITGWFALHAFALARGWVETTHQAIAAPPAAPLE